MTNFMLLFMTSMIPVEQPKKKSQRKLTTNIHTGLAAFSSEYSPRQFKWLSLSSWCKPHFCTDVFMILNAIFDGTSAVTYVSFKAIYSGILALFFSPCVIILAMAEYATLKTVDSYPKSLSKRLL